MNKSGFTTPQILIFVLALAVVAGGYFVFRLNTLGPQCGGIAGISCPSGYSCRIEGNYPDAGGRCYPIGKYVSPEGKTYPNPEEPTSTGAQMDVSSWQTYRNEQYDFEIEYPPYLTAGGYASNSVLGTFSEKVPGVYVGQLVLIVIDTPVLKDKAEKYLQTLSDLAEKDQKDYVSENGSPPPVTCSITEIPSVDVQIKAFFCSQASYAFVTGGKFDVFVDGYSHGFEDTHREFFKDTNEMRKVLSTFKFVSK